MGVKSKDEDLSGLGQDCELVCHAGSRTCNNLSVVLQCGKIMRRIWWYLTARERDG